MTASCLPRPIASKPSKPGVWRRKEGGFLVRARPKDPRTGKPREIRMTLLDVRDAYAAYEVLQHEVRRVREGLADVEPKSIRFDDYSVSLLERKLRDREIKSAKSKEIWATARKK